MSNYFCLFNYVIAIVTNEIQYICLTIGPVGLLSIAKIDRPLVEKIKTFRESVKRITPINGEIFVKETNLSFTKEEEGLILRFQTQNITHPSCVWHEPFCNGEISKWRSIESYIGLLLPDTKSIKKLSKEIKREHLQWIKLLGLKDVNKITSLLKINVPKIDIGINGGENKIIEWLGVEKTFNLILKGEADSLIDAFDLANQLLEENPTVSIQFGRIRNGKELVDEMKIQLELAKPSLVLLEYSNLKTLEGGVYGKYILEVPRSSTDLALIGKDQNHCVGSYTEQINSGQSFIATLNFEGKIVFTIEWCSELVVQQVMGKNNSISPPEIWELVKTIPIKKV